MSILERIKIRLNFTDTTYDVILNGYIAIIEAKLKLKYSWDVIPDDYQYLVENLVYAIMRIKKKINIEYDNDARDDDILTTLDDVYQEFINFCHLTYLPKDLVTELIEGCSLKIKQPDVSHNVDPSTKVKSIQEGDTKVSFGATSGPSNSNISKNYAEFFQDIESKLKEFRVFGY